MDGETDFGLFEIIIILAAIGVGGYLIYKAFSSNPLTPCPALAASELQTDVTGQICPNGALAKCIEKTVGCKAAADYGIAQENKLTACCSILNPIQDIQRAFNYYFGTSWGVGSGTAGTPAATAPAAAMCKCPCTGQPYGTPCTQPYGC